MKLFLASVGDFFIFITSTSPYRALQNKTISITIWGIKNKIVMSNFQFILYISATLFILVFWPLVTLKRRVKHNKIDKLIANHSIEAEQIKLSEGGNVIQRTALGMLSLFIALIVSSTLYAAWKPDDTNMIIGVASVFFFAYGFSCLFNFFVCKRWIKKVLKNNETIRFVGSKLWGLMYLLLSIVGLAMTFGIIGATFEDIVSIKEFGWKIIFLPIGVIFVLQKSVRLLRMRGLYQDSIITIRSATKTKHIKINQIWNIKLDIKHEEVSFLGKLDESDEAEGLVPPELYSGNIKEIRGLASLVYVLANLHSIPVFCETQKSLWSSHQKRPVKLINGLYQKSSSMPSVKNL